MSVAPSPMEPCDLDSIIDGGNLLVKGTDAYRYVGTDGYGILGRFKTRQLVLTFEEEERQRKIILDNADFRVERCLDLFEDLTLEIWIGLAERHVG